MECVGSAEEALGQVAVLGCGDARAGAFLEAGFGLFALTGVVGSSSTQPLRIEDLDNIRRSDCSVVAASEAP